jgi:peroxiredoxin Q/BCP
MLDLTQTYVFSDGAAKKINLEGKRFLLLYFYPKDMTSGCTQQANDLKDHYQQLQEMHTEVIGVSRDSAKRHAKFIEKENLPFDLIADTDSELCRLFDVLKMKSMYGRTYEGIERSTFLLDNDGNVLNEWRKVKVGEHMNHVLEVLREKE